MADAPRVILSGFADEAANQKTATQQFETVDKFFKILMAKIEKNPSASKLIKSQP